MIQNHTIATSKRNHKAVRLQPVPTHCGSPIPTIRMLDEVRIAHFAAQWLEAATRAESANEFHAYCAARCEAK